MAGSYYDLPEHSKLSLFFQVVVLWLQSQTLLHRASESMNFMLTCFCLQARGPAASTSDTDVIDEALAFFRANVLFRSFEVKGASDKLLVYLTLYIGSCLRCELSPPSQLMLRFPSSLSSSGSVLGTIAYLMIILSGQ